MPHARILIVDDSRTVRMRVRQIFEGNDQFDYEVIDATDGGHALQLLERTPIDLLPDLILLDRNMPNVSGDACIRFLKSDPVWKNIPVIFLTAQADKVEVVKGLSLLGCNDYLSKPFDTGEMVARVHALVRVKKAEDENRRLNRDLEAALEAQQKAYAELRQSEEKVRLLLESVGEGVLGIDLDGQITFANPQATSLLGYSPDDMIGHNAHSLFHHSDPNGTPSPPELCLWQKTLSEGTSCHVEDEVFWHKNGSFMEVEYRSTEARHGGETVGAVLSFNDISERKRLQKERDRALAIMSESIRYASRIQRSVLPDTALFDTLFADYFIHWDPRDMVSGDIYWCDTWGNGTLLILGDCTGHGVPGAFMTLIAGGALGRARGEIPAGDVPTLMQRMHQIIQNTLGQNTETGESDDGIELGICYFHGNPQQLTYVGARFDLFVYDGNAVTEIKGNKKGIGYRNVPYTQRYDGHEIPLFTTSSYYLATDGLIDQIGGTNRRAFGKNRFKELLLSVQMLPMAKQKETIQQALDTFRGEERRRDDISVIGFKVVTAHRMT